MALEIFQFGGLDIFGETISNDVTFSDDKLLRLGTDGDQVLLNRSTTLNANTALTSVLVGTPVTPALAANSLIISNITTDGDILIAASDGGHSRTALFFDASTPDTYLYNVGGTWTAGATTWTIPAVTLGGAVAAGGYAITNIGGMTFTACQFWGCVADDSFIYLAGGTSAASACIVFGGKDKATNPGALEFYTPNAALAQTIRLIITGALDTVVATCTNLTWTGLNITSGQVLKVGGTQVVAARVVDARIDDAINSGDATTDGVIDALRDWAIAWGAMAAA